jgi:hypothetical protein
MAQLAPTKGQENVYPTAIAGVREFVDHARPELEFILSYTESRLDDRVSEGHKKYGTLLQTFNGRDALQDAWEESADLVFYLEQAMMELPKDRQHELFVIADLAREALLLIGELRVKKELGIGG